VLQRSCDQCAGAASRPSPSGRSPWRSDEPRCHRRTACPASSGRGSRDNGPTPDELSSPWAGRTRPRPTRGRGAPAPRLSSAGTASTPLRAARLGQSERQKRLDHQRQPRVGGHDGRGADALELKPKTAGAYDRREKRPSAAGSAQSARRSGDKRGPRPLPHTCDSRPMWVRSFGVRSFTTPGEPASAFFFMCTLISARSAVYARVEGCTRGCHHASAERRQNRSPKRSRSHHLESRPLGSRSGRRGER